MFPKRYKLSSEDTLYVFHNINGFKQDRRNMAFLNNIKCQSTLKDNCLQNFHIVKQINSV